MTSAYEEIRRSGGHILAYTNPRIFSLRSIYWQRMGESLATRTASGDVHKESYSDGADFAVVCPAASAWRGLFADYAEMLAGQYSADLIYFDQVASAPPVQCFAGGHEHYDPGLWNTHYMGLLDEAANRVNAVSRDASFCIEGCGDLFIRRAPFQSYIGFMISGTRFNFPELFKYTFPEAVQADVVYYQEETPGSMYADFLPSAKRPTIRACLERGIMVGDFFGVMDQVLDDTEWWAEAQDLLRLRRLMAPWIARAKFRDSADVIEGGGLDVRTFQREGSPSHVVVVARGGADEEIPVRIRLHGRTASGAFALTEGGQVRLAMSQAADGVSISVRAGTLSVSIIQLDGDGAA